MLELLKLSFKNIGRFIEEQTICFDQHGAFIQLDANNKNTGGSSGSGKTTVFNALDYLLGLNDTAATVLQSRFTKEAIAVTGTFAYDSKPLIISRIKGKVRFELDGKVTEGSNALAEEKIDTVLGMPRPLFRKILHKRQKEGGFFIDMTAAEKHDFLTDALSLGEIRKKSSIVDMRTKELDTRKNRLLNDLQSNQSGLDVTVEAVLALGMPPIKEMHREVILDLKTKSDNAVEEFNIVNSRHGIEMATLEAGKPDIKMTSFDRADLDQYNKERKGLELKLGALLLAERDRQNKIKNAILALQNEKRELNHKVTASDKAQIESQKIAEQVKAIRKCECPTCAQSWANDHSKATEQALMQKIVGHITTIKEGKAAQQRMTLIDTEIENLQPQALPQYDPQMPEINEQIVSKTSLILTEKDKYDAHAKQQSLIAGAESQVYESKRTGLYAAHRTESDQLRGQVDVTRRILDAAVAKLKAYEEASTRYTQTHSILIKKQEDLTLKVTNGTLELDTTDKELLKAEGLKKAIKMYVSYSFDGALEDIGTKATEIIRCIPNMANATIQFEGTKETKDGKIKEEVNAVIGMDGETGVPIKSLSGGERSAVDLAVDLAVIDFIEHKSAKGMNLFILDEPFTGLGTVEIEMALEVLKNSNTNKKIIIVDHNPEVKEMVQSRIVVEREGTTSKLTS